MANKLIYFNYSKLNSEGDILYEEVQLCIKYLSRIRTPQFSGFCELFKRIRQASYDNVALPITELSSSVNTRRASHLFNS